MNINGDNEEFRLKTRDLLKKKDVNIQNILKLMNSLNHERVKGLNLTGLSKTKQTLIISIPIKVNRDKWIPVYFDIVRSSDYSNWKIAKLDLSKK